MKMWKKVLTAIAVFICVLAVAGFVIVFSVSWIWGGFRFSPEAAVEAASLNASKRERIEVDGYTFFYDTDGENGDWISGVMTVKQNGRFRYYPITKPDSIPLVIDETGERVGRLIMLEGKGCYYNFFLPTIPEGNLELAPDFLKNGYRSVTANGKEVEIYKHSYFVTDAEVDELVINGTKLVNSE